MGQWWESTPYETWEPLSLPYKGKRPELTVTHFELTCTLCGRPVTQLRAQFNEWGNCIEVMCGGLCYDCKLVQYGRWRWYKDGRLLLEGRHGWGTYRMRERITPRSLWRKIIRLTKGR